MKQSKFLSAPPPAQFRMETNTVSFDTYAKGKREYEVSFNKTCSEWVDELLIVAS